MVKRNLFTFNFICIILGIISNILMVLAIAGFPLFSIGFFNFRIIILSAIIMGILVGMLGLAAGERSLRLFNDKWKDKLKPYVNVVTIICIILNITALILSIMYFRGNW